LMSAGFNELSLWCNADIREMSAPMIVDEVLVEVSY